MIDYEDMKSIAPKAPVSYPSAENVSTGLPIEKVIRVKTFSPAEWESFTEEWASALKDLYISVRRYGGAGDQGIDVAGYTTDKDLEGEWDNYQCKHYDHALTPSDIRSEFGKLIYYSYKQNYSVPRKYYFVAPCGIGTKLTRLFRNPLELKQDIKSNWEKYCKDKITKNNSIELEKDLLDWFESFDFSIFSMKSVVEMIEQHSETPFHSVRFGGGLPPRPAVPTPPEDHDVTESRYVKQLLNAYANHLGTPINNIEELSTSSKPALRNDFSRQRERFYHAEYLRNYARDTVSDGTFERLQQEIYHGVVDIYENDHADGLVRMRATISQAAQIAITSNPLSTVVQTQDRQGICHQLANEDQLIWVSTDEGGGI
ncbi:MAG: ABC-three component system protein [Synechocystis sp.]